MRDKIQYKYKKWRHLYIFFSLVVIITIPLQNVEAKDDNPLLAGDPFKDRKGSVYYPTSAIREWLNGDKQVTEYTNAVPKTSQGYEKEGFLYEFTKQEKEGIAVTERRAFVHKNVGNIAIDGGSINSPRYDGYFPTTLVNIASTNIDKDWKKVTYRVVYDKVFFLGTNEMYEYVQKRGKSFDRGGDYLTSTYNYTNNNNSMMWIIDGGGKLGAGGSVRGIVPSIHLKPTYVLGDGRKASELKINDEVAFGTYNGKTIKWEVINKTPEGYPLLWSKKYLTKKQFSTPTEILYKDSEYVKYEKPDISIKDDLKYTNGTTDTTEPTIVIENESEIYKRQNGSFKLKLQAIDLGGSGISHIILPSGNKVLKDTIEYEINENGRYEFIAVDRSGNHWGFQIPIGNINSPAGVIVEPNTTEWTNKDVKVNVTTTEANTTREIGTAKDKHSFDEFPEYTTYADKKFRITGKVRKDKAIDDRYSAVVRMTYNKIIKIGDTYFVQKVYPTPVDIPLKQIDTEKYTIFDETFTMSGDYYGGLSPYLGMSMGGIYQNDYGVEWKDVKVELLDKDYFYIEKIILPSGKEISNDIYTDTLTESGTYTYTVLDNRGKETKKSVTVKIDKVKPTLEITQSDTSKTVQSTTLTVTASDKDSGLDYIELPNGEQVKAGNNEKIEYEVTKNGSYTFKAYDKAGNVTTKDIKVENIIDKNTIEIQLPKVKPLKNVKIPKNEEIISMEHDGNLIINEYRKKSTDWRLEVGSTQLVNEEGYKLPKGTLRMNKPSKVTVKGSGKVSLPEITKGKGMIDREKVIIAKGTKSTDLNEYNFELPKELFEIIINPTTVKVGEYSTRVTWDIVEAP